MEIVSRHLKARTFVVCRSRIGPVGIEGDDIIVLRLGRMSIRVRVRRQKVVSCRRTTYVAATRVVEETLCGPLFGRVF